MRRVITSRENETLRLVRKLLGQRKHRDRTGLFAAEGEDLVDAARDARIEPVHLLVAGETVEAGLLERVSTLPHPARAIGVYRRADLPTGTRRTCLALWHLGDPGNVGTLVRTADAFGACVAFRMGAPTRCPRRRCARRRAPSSVSRSSPGTSAPVAASRSSPTAATRYTDVDLAPPVTFLLGAERAGLPEERIAECDRATISLSGDAESLNVAAAGAIALYELSRRQAEGRGRV